MPIAMEIQHLCIARHTTVEPWKQADHVVKKKNELQYFGDVSLLVAVGSLPNDYSCSFCAVKSAKYLIGLVSVGV